MKYIIFTIYIPYITYLTYKKYTPVSMYNALKSKLKGISVFNTYISCVSPYSGSISPYVEEMTESKVKVSMTEHRNIKNPFNSIHTIALSNLGELTSGLLMMEHMKSTNKSGIITSIKTYYHKKARGKITAICDNKWTKQNITKTRLYNTSKELVCEVNCKWKLNDIM